MTSVAPRSERQKPPYYVIVDSSEKVISPGSPLVTLYEQRCFTYFKLLQLKRKREEEKGITLIQKLPQIQDSNG